MPEDEVIKLLCRGCGHKTDARRLGTDTDGNEVYDGLTVANPEPSRLMEDYLRVSKQRDDMTEEAEKWRHKAIIAEDNYRKRLADLAGIPRDQPSLWRRVVRKLTQDLSQVPTNGANKENSK